ncbi:MAG: alpha-ribazole phosphatase [Roseivirga sp.]|nr:alpha-ribazole phosphatase [Roseivirga sp.]
MDIYLIRHTTPEIEKGICYGQTDLALASSFPEELKQIKEKRVRDFDRIYASPLKRCLQLADEFGNQVRTDARLMEMNFGAWEMEAWDDIPADQLNPWMADFVNTRVPEGEAFQDLIIRVNEALHEILESDLERVMIVTHAGVIRAVLGFFLGLQPENLFRLNVDYGGITRVEVKRGMYNVKYINR